MSYTGSSEDPALTAPFFFTPVHTMHYLRRTSSVLFSTVLASSSRFFRHDLHPTLLSHARTVLDRALQAGSTDIGVVQSLMVLTYWKDPEDTSGWMKVGMAIRLGYSLFWHIPRTEPLPDDEMEAREILNAERTWFCLFSFDRGQSYVHGLPTVIRLTDHADPEVWSRQHLHLGPSVDMHISASIQLCKLKDHWGEVCESKCSDPAYLELAIETLITQCDALIHKWFNKEAPPPCFDTDVEHVLLWSILDFMFIMKRFHLDMAPHDQLRLDSCLHIVARVADEVDILASNGMLVIMQDSASCMTSSLVVFMRKVGATVGDSLTNPRSCSASRTAPKSRTSSPCCTASSSPTRPSPTKTPRRRRRTSRALSAASCRRCRSNRVPDLRAPEPTCSTARRTAKRAASRSTSSPSSASKSSCTCQSMWRRTRQTTGGTGTCRWGGT